MNRDRPTGPHTQKYGTANMSFTKRAAVYAAAARARKGLSTSSVDTFEDNNSSTLPGYIQQPRFPGHPQNQGHNLPQATRPVPESYTEQRRKTKSSYEADLQEGSYEYGDHGYDYRKNPGAQSPRIPNASHPHLQAQSPRMPSHSSLQASSPWTKSHPHLQASTPSPRIQSQPCPRAPTPLIQSHPLRQAPSPQSQLQPDHGVSNPRIQSHHRLQAPTPLIQSHHRLQAPTPLMPSKPCPGAPRPLMALNTEQQSIGVFGYETNAQESYVDYCDHDYRTDQDYRTDHGFRGCNLGSFNTATSTTETKPWSANTMQSAKQTAMLKSQSDNTSTILQQNLHLDSKQLTTVDKHPHIEVDKAAKREVPLTARTVSKTTENVTPSANPEKSAGTLETQISSKVPTSSSHSVMDTGTSTSKIKIAPKQKTGIKITLKNPILKSTAKTKASLSNSQLTDKSGQPYFETHDQTASDSTEDKKDDQLYSPSYATEDTKDEELYSPSHTTDDTKDDQLYSPSHATEDIKDNDLYSPSHTTEDIKDNDLYSPSHTTEDINDDLLYSPSYMLSPSAEAMEGDELYSNYLRSPSEEEMEDDPLYSPSYMLSPSVEAVKNDQPYSPCQMLSSAADLGSKSYSASASPRTNRSNDSWNNTRNKGTGQPHYGSHGNISSVSDLDRPRKSRWSSDSGHSTQTTEKGIGQPFSGKKTNISSQATLDSTRSRSSDFQAQEKRNQSNISSQSDVDKTRSINSTEVVGAGSSWQFSGSRGHYSRDTYNTDRGTVQPFTGNQGYSWQPMEDSYRKNRQTYGTSRGRGTTQNNPAPRSILKKPRTNKEVEMDGYLQNGYCILCKISIWGPVAYRKHCQGLLHRTKLESAELAKKSKDDKAVTEGGQDSSDMNKQGTGNATKDNEVKHDEDIGDKSKVIKQEVKVGDKDKKEDTSQYTTNQTVLPGLDIEEDEDEDEEDTSMCIYCNMKFTNSDSYYKHTRGMLHTQNLMAAEAKKSQTKSDNSKGPFETVTLKSAAEETEDIKLREFPSLAFKQPEYDYDYDDDDNYDFTTSNWMSLLDEPKIPASEKDLAPKDIGKKLDAYYCEICKVSCTGEITYNMHISGSKHKSKSSLMQNVKMLSGHVPETEEPTLIEDESLTPEIENRLKQSEVPLIGLQYVTEYQTSGKTPNRYVCNLCEAKCDANTIIAHVVGTKHRMKYFKENHYAIHNHISKYTSAKKKSELSIFAENMAKQVFEKEGPMKMKVKAESKEPHIDSLSTDEAAAIKLLASKGIFNASVAKLLTGAVNISESDDEIDPSPSRTKQKLREIEPVEDEEYHPMSIFRGRNSQRTRERPPHAVLYDYGYKPTMDTDIEEPSTSRRPSSQTEQYSYYGEMEKQNYENYDYPGDEYQRYREPSAPKRQEKMVYRSVKISEMEVKDYRHGEAKKEEFMSLKKSIESFLVVPQEQETTGIGKEQERGSSIIPSTPTSEVNPASQESHTPYNQSQATAVSKPQYPAYSGYNMNYQDQQALYSQNQQAGIPQNPYAAIQQNQQAYTPQNQPVGIPQNSIAGVPKKQPTGILKNPRVHIPQNPKSIIAQNQQIGISQNSNAGIPHNQQVGFPKNLTAGSQNPQTMIPQNSQAMILQNSQAMIPQNSQAMIPQNSQANPRNSQVMIPQNSQAMIPQNSQVIIPQNSQAMVPQNSQAMIPQSSQAMVLQNSQAMVLQNSQAIYPQSSQAINPQSSQAMIPQNSQAMIPENSQAMIPQSSQAMVLQNPQAMIPQNSQAVNPQNSQPMIPQNPPTCLSNTLQKPVSYQGHSTPQVGNSKTQQSQIQLHEVKNPQVTHADSQNLQTITSHSQGSTQLATPAKGDDFHIKQPGHETQSGNSKPGTSKSTSQKQTKKDSGKVIAPVTDNQAEDNPINTAIKELLGGLESSLIKSEDEASMALQVSNALTQALLNYRLKNVPQEVKESITSKMAPPLPQAQTIGGIKRPSHDQITSSAVVPKKAKSDSPIPGTSKSSTSQSSSSVPGFPHHSMHMPKATVGHIQGQPAAVSRSLNVTTYPDTCLGQTHSSATIKPVKLQHGQVPGNYNMQGSYPGVSQARKVGVPFSTKQVVNPAMTSASQTLKHHSDKSSSQPGSIQTGAQHITGTFQHSLLQQFAPPFPPLPPPKLKKPPLPPMPPPK